MRTKLETCPTSRKAGRLLAGLVTAICLLGSGCASGGGSSGGSAATTTPLFDGSTTAPAKIEFQEEDGVNVRFANFYWNQGEGQPIDVYWGSDPQSGEKAVTLDYGEVSEYFTAKKDPESFDPQSLFVTFTLEGKTDEESVLMSTSDSIGEGDQATIVFSASNNQTDGRQNTQFGTVWEEESQGMGIGEAPNGKAGLWTNDLGLYGIPEESARYVEPGTATGCLQLELAGNQSTGNAGGPNPVDPGQVSVAAFDINNNCAASAQATDYLNLETEAGERILIFPYGFSRETRRLVAAPVKEP